MSKLYSGPEVRKRKLVSESNSKVIRRNNKEPFELMNIINNEKFTSISLIKNQLNASAKQLLELNINVSGKINSDILFLSESNFEQNIKMTCTINLIRYKDILKVNFKLLNLNQILFEDVQKLIGHISEIIKLNKPKLIVTFGEISANIIRQYKNFEKTCKGRKKYNYYQGKTYNNSNQEEKHYFKFVEKLNNIYYNDNKLSIYSINELKHNCFVLSFYNQYPENKFNNNIEDDFKLIKKYFSFISPRWFDVSETIDETNYNHIKYDDPSDIFYINEFFINDDMLFDNWINNNILRMDVKTVEYNIYRNEFGISGRTIEGLPIYLRTFNNWFNFRLSIEKFKNDNNNQNIIIINDQYLLKFKNHILGFLKFQSINTTTTISVVLEKEFIRNALKFQKNKIVAINIKYDNYKYFEEIKEACINFLNNQCIEDYTLYETFLTPKQMLMFNNGIYMNGWIEVKKANLFQKFEEKKKSIGSYEFKVNSNNIKGFSPMNGEEKDKIYESIAPTVYLSEDFEMLGYNGKFPQWYESPINSMCASLYTSKSNIERAIEFERKDQIKFNGKQTEVKKTGQVESDELFVFSLGKVDPKKYNVKEFSRKLLPNIPRINKKKIKKLKIKNKSSKLIKNDIDFINKYLNSVLQWIKYVGLYRANQIYKYSNKFFDRCITNYILDDKNYNDKFSTIIKYIVYIRRNTFKNQDIVEFKDENDWKTLFESNIDNLNDSEVIKSFGLIQVNCKKINKLPKIFSFKSEEDMIRGYENIRNQTNFDVLTGYNIDNFDEPYLHNRKKLLGILNERGNIVSCSRIKNESTIIKTKKFSSKQIGNRKITNINIPTRSVFDLYNYCTTKMKERSYTLNYIAQVVLGDTKIDLPYDAISYTFKSNREILNAYCSWDSILPYSIINTKGIDNFVISLSRIASTMSIGELFSKGEQEKILMNLIRFMRKDGLNQYIPDENQFNQYEYPESGTGAYVFDLVPGLHTNIPTLDYRSLYPSIMIAYNLSQNTMGIKEDIIKWGFDIKKDCIRSHKKYVNYKTNDPFDLVYYYFIQIKELTKEEVIQNGYILSECEKIKRNDNNEIKYIPKVLIGLLPKMTNKLLIARKAIKKLMYAAKPGSIEQSNRNSQQETVKLMANSVYGGTAFPKSKIASRVIQEFITLEGQKRIKELAYLLETKYDDCKIIGGDTDSVFPKFDRVKHINDLFIDYTDINPITNQFETKPFIEHVVDQGNSVLPNGMKLEFESVYTKFFPALKEGSFDETAKKKVACMIIVPIYNLKEKKWIIPKKADIFYKGIEAKRRDSPIVVQNTMTNFFEILFNSKDVKEGRHKAVEYLKKKVEKVRTQDTNISKLIISKQLQDNYKSTKQSHLALIAKMKKRGDSIPEVGTRVPYVLITSNAKNNYEKVEDPIIVIRDKLEIDKESYIKKIKKSLSRFTNQFIKEEMDMVTTSMNNLKKRSHELEKYIYGYIEGGTQISERLYRYTANKSYQKINLDVHTDLSDFIEKKNHCINCNKIIITNEKKKSSLISMFIIDDNNISNTDIYNNKNKKNICFNCENKSITIHTVIEKENRNLINYKKKKEKVLKTCRKCFKIDDLEDKSMEIKCTNVFCLSNYDNKIKSELNVLTTEDKLKNLKNKIEDIEDLMLL